MVAQGCDRPAMLEGGGAYSPCGGGGRSSMAGSRVSLTHGGCREDALGSSGEGMVGRGVGHQGAEAVGRAAPAGGRDLPADHRPPGRGGEGARAQAASRGGVHGPRAEGEARRQDSRPAMQGARRAMSNLREASLGAWRGPRGV